ncbi:thiamine pyrophosphate-binding protein, partial [Sinorhizobium medicae]|nr:thiamine pyrophosphate-binding protein [Sinorhizobium medicae]
MTIAEGPSRRLAAVAGCCHRRRCLSMRGTGPASLNRFWSQPMTVAFRSKPVTVE